MTETRIRWEPTEYGGWTGHVGTLEPFVFQIHEARAWKVLDLIDGWALASALPGELGHYVRRDHPDELKAEAERWLEEFVSSLGAIFPPEPDQRTALQLIEARSILARWDAEQEPKPVIERVLADQVKALLLIAETAVTAAREKE